jgi:hypothetical protein
MFSANVMEEMMKRILTALAAVTLAVGLLMSCTPPVGGTASDATAAARGAATAGILPYCYYTPKGTMLSTWNVSNPWECNCHSFAWQNFTLPVTETDFPNPYYYLSSPAPFIADGSVTLVGSCQNDGSSAFPAGAQSGDKITFGSSQNDFRYSATNEGNTAILYYNLGDNAARVDIPWNFSQLRYLTMYFWRASDSRFYNAPMGPRRLVTIKAYYNGKYVCADYNNNGAGPNANWPLWSNRDSAATMWNSWEYFFIVQKNGNYSDVGLWSQGSMSYVTTDGPSRATANAAYLGTNQTFNLSQYSGNIYYFQWKGTGSQNNWFIHYNSMNPGAQYKGPGSRFYIDYINR